MTDYKAPAPLEFMYCHPLPFVFPQLSGRQNILDLWRATRSLSTVGVLSHQKPSTEAKSWLIRAAAPRGTHHEFTAVSREKRFQLPSVYQMAKGENVFEHQGRRVCTRWSLLSFCFMLNTHGPV